MGTIFFQKELFMEGGGGVGGGWRLFGINLFKANLNVFHWCVDGDAGS